MWSATDIMALPLDSTDLPRINAYWKGWDTIAPEHADAVFAKINRLLVKDIWRIADIQAAKELARDGRFLTDYAFCVKNSHPLYRRYVGEAVEPPRVSLADMSRFCQENPGVPLESLPPDSPYRDPRFRIRSVTVDPGAGEPN
jgi:hypothetical protein